MSRRRSRGADNGIIVVGSDLTYLRRIEQELYLRNRRIESIAIGVTISDYFQPDLSFISVNRGLTEMTGYSAEEVVGRNCRFLQGDEDLHKERARIRQAIEAGEQITVLLRNYPKNGELFWNELTLAPVHNEAGTLTHYLGFQQDVTRLIESAELLRSGNNRMWAILDTAVDAIVTIDARGIVESFNPAAEQIFGYVAEEVIGRNVSMLMPQPYRDAHDGYVPSYLDTGVAKIIGSGREVEGVRKNGEIFVMELAESEMEVDGLRMFTGIVRDITERKQIDRIKAKLVSIVSHELRTPLTSIMGSLGLMNGGSFGELPGAAKRMVEIALQNSDRLVRLINDMLDIEKIESGKMDFRMVPVEMSELLEQAVEANAGFASQFGVQLVLCGTRTHISVLGDADRITQVMTNLLSNAVKFSNEGGRVEIHIERADGAIRVTVRDHGTGIPEEYHTWIFEKFGQADPSASRKKGGTGLGLSICKAIVEHHGGTIGLEFEVDKGSTFYFTLPDIASSTRVAPVAEPEPPLYPVQDQDISDAVRLP